MKIVFMGTPEFSVSILEGLAQKYDVALVISQPNQLVKKKIVYTPVAIKAIELSISLWQGEKIADAFELIKDTNADILVTAAYGQFVPQRILKLFKKCINVHGSLLPRRRGGAPIQRAIMEGDSTTGVTIMEMVKQMDAGRMYAKREIPILDSDNNDSLFKKLSFVGRELLLETIEDIYQGKNEGIVQDESLVTISPNIRVEEEKISFNHPARVVFNQIRGLSENPGAYGVINDTRIKVYESRIVDDSSDATAGTVIMAKKRLIVKCSDNAIELLQIKPQGKPCMPASSFLNGQRIFSVGDKFE